MVSSILSNKVWCPLCEKEMISTSIVISNKTARMFLCRPCQVGIYDFDPAFNKWRDTDKDIPCSVCGYEKVKWFARFMDGFFKSVCPKCGTGMKKDGDVRFGKGGNIILPEEMEQEEIEEPVEIKIPLSHLEKKLGKDKVNELKNKRNRG
jgi:hypothetical protein